MSVAGEMMLSTWFPTCLLCVLLYTVEARSLARRDDVVMDDWALPSHASHLVLDTGNPKLGHRRVADLQLMTSLPAHLECPQTSDGRQLFPCVTPQDADVIVCIDEHALCDDVVHCPNGADEDGTVCMFHKLTLSYFKLVMATIFGLTRSAV